jgi:hypothetical protein
MIEQFLNPDEYKKDANLRVQALSETPQVKEFLKLLKQLDR